MSMLKLTVFGMGVIAWKYSRDPVSLVDSQYELTRSQRDRLVQFVDLNLLELLTT